MTAEHVKKTAEKLHVAALADMRQALSEDIGWVEFGNRVESILQAHDAAILELDLAEESEWEVEEIQYGHLLAGGIFLIEHKGKNYSTHQRRIKLGRPESSWLPAEQEGEPNV